MAVKVSVVTRNVTGMFKVVGFNEFSEATFIYYTNNEKEANLVAEQWEEKHKKS